MTRAQIGDWALVSGVPGGGVGGVGGAGSAVKQRV